MRQPLFASLPSPPLAARTANAPRVDTLPLALAGAAMGIADLLVAIAYWWPAGVAPIRIPQSIAAWVLGPGPALAGGLATAALGVLVYCGLTAAMPPLYRRLATRSSLLLRRPLACGALFGVAMYVLLFQVIAPLLVPPARPQAPEWIATCVVAYVALIGVPCAWLARATLPRARRQR